MFALRGEWEIYVRDEEPKKGRKIGEKRETRGARQTGVSSCNDAAPTRSSARSREGKKESERGQPSSG